MKSVLRRKEVRFRSPGKQVGDRPWGPEHISILLCVRECLLASRVPVRESGRLRPLIAGYTAEKCSAEAETHFVAVCPTGMDDRCLTRHLVTVRCDGGQSRRECNEVSLQTHTLFIVYRAHEPEKCFRSEAAAFSRFVYPATHGRGLYRPPHRYRSNCKGLYRPPHRYRSNCKGLSDLRTGIGLTAKVFTDLRTGIGLTAKVFQTSAQVPV